jgi:hypothetical protein
MAMSEEQKILGQKLKKLLEIKLKIKKKLQQTN